MISSLLPYHHVPAVTPAFPKCPKTLGTLAAQRRGYFAPQGIASVRVIRIGLP